jgi:glycosyltransferase involved in cell wall biosynthesis
MKKLSIIIPVYNEARTIEAVIRVIHELELTAGIEKEIIIVDDCSTDDSNKIIKDVLKELDSQEIFVCEHLVNKGKGGAIQTGIKAVTGDYIIIQDADLELVPAEINDLIKVVLDKKADIVYGSRFLNKEVKGGSWLSNRANAFLTWLSNRVFRIRITDMETCYKLVPADVFKSVQLMEQRFGFEPEITAKLAKHRGLKWAEVPITYNPRTNVQGKKIGWKDGFRAVWCILKYGWGK